MCLCSAFFDWNSAPQSRHLRSEAPWWTTTSRASLFPRAGAALLHPAQQGVVLLHHPLHTHEPNMLPESGLAM